MPLGAADDLPGRRARRRCSCAARHARRPRRGRRARPPRPACRCSSSGRGSNLLVADAGFAGIGDRRSATLDAIASPIDGERDGRRRAPAGACRCRCSPGARRPPASTGFEWAVGVPGSIGGAVRMNAGGHGSDMAACLARRRTCFDLRHRRRSRRLPAGDARSAVPRLGPRPTPTSCVERAICARAAVTAAPSEARDRRDRALAAGAPAGRAERRLGVRQPGAGRGRAGEPRSTGSGCAASASARRGCREKHANFIQADRGWLGRRRRRLMTEVRAAGCEAPHRRATSSEMRLRRLRPGPAAPRGRDRQAASAHDGRRRPPRTSCRLPPRSEPRDRSTRDRRSSACDLPVLDALSTSAGAVIAVLDGRGGCPRPGRRDEGSRRAAPHRPARGAGGGRALVVARPGRRLRSSRAAFDVDRVRRAPTPTHVAADADPRGTAVRSADPGRRRRRSSRAAVERLPWVDDAGGSTIDGGPATCGSASPSGCRWRSGGDQRPLVVVLGVDRPGARPSCRGRRRLSPVAAVATSAVEPGAPLSPAIGRRRRPVAGSPCCPSVDGRLSPWSPAGTALRLGGPLGRAPSPRPATEMPRRRPTPRWPPCRCASTRRRRRRHASRSARRCCRGDAQRRPSRGDPSGDMISTTVETLVSACDRRGQRSPPAYGPPITNRRST